MSLSAALILKQEITPKLMLFIGETIGDIPVYSLHRIKNLLAKKGITVSSEMKAILLRQLISANATYKKESGNDWSCLTSNNLIQAFEGMEEEAVSIIEKSLASQPRECTTQVMELKNHLLKLRDDNMMVVKRWFEENYDLLLYNLNGNIPWGVIMKLRRNLSIWIVGNSNPFDEDIETAIIDIAEEQGIHAKDAEDAWKKMGGKIFKKRKL